MKRYSFLVVTTLLVWTILLIPAYRAWAADLNVGSAGLTLTANMQVTGNVIVNGGTLDINGFTLTVTGNLDITGTNGWLKMVKATDVVDVAGNVTFNGASSKDFLTAGTMKVGGHFYQKGTNYSATVGPVETNNRNSFTATGTHKVILNGTGRQDISFESASDVYSHFQNIEVSKPASALATLLSDDGEALSDNFTAQGTWGIGSAAFEGSGAWSDSPAGNYADSMDASLTSKTLNLTNAQGVYLSFAHRYDVEQNYDFGKVDVSTNNGGTWTEVASFTGKQDAWDVKILDLSTYAGQGTFQFRLRLKSNAVLNYDGWQIDKIRLYTVTGSPVRLTGDHYVTGQWLFSADTVIMGISTHDNSVVTFSGGTMDLQGHALALPTDLIINNTGIRNGTLTIPNNLTIAGGTVDFKGGTITVPNTLTVNGGTVNLNGGSMTVQKGLAINQGAVDLQGGTMAVTGDVTVKSTLALTNSVLTVAGNLTISGNGILDVNGGKCVVGGNLTVDGWSTAYLKMVNSADVVEVGGNALFKGRNTYWVDNQVTYAYLSAGVLKVKGDFTQQYPGYGVYSNFRASGTHKVVLNGTAKQTVSFNNPNDSYFQDLEIANTSAEGVVFGSTISLSGYFSSVAAAKISFADPSFKFKAINLLTLTQDMTIATDLTIDGPMDLSGHILTVTGNLTVTNTLDLKGGTVTVTGNLTISGNGILDVNGGKCVVGGNLTVDGWSAAYLKMVNSADVVEVGGNALFKGRNTYWVDNQVTYAYLSAGVLKVKGDFTQQYPGYGVYSNFRASGTHKVVLNGTAKQTVSFDNPTSSYFQDLEIANTSAEGVVFTPAKQVIVMGVLTITSGQAIGVNHPPRITSMLLNTTWYRDLPNAYQVVVEDLDLLDPTFGEQITITIDTDPAKGVKITSGGLLYWTPTRDQAGQHTIIVTVKDKLGVQSQQTLTITVAHPLAESPDNDTLAQATPIAIANRVVKADLTVPSGTGKDLDYYKITLTENRKIRVSLVTLGANKYLLDVLDGQGNSLGKINLTGNSAWPVEQWLDLGLTTGSYYFKVLADQATYTADQVYGVGYMDLGSFVAPDQTKTVAFGTEYQDVLLTTLDRRYYQFNLGQGGAVTIAFTNPTLSDYRFFLKNAAGDVLETFQLPAGLDLAGKLNLPAGEYTLAIEPAGYIDASKNFTLKFTSSTVDDLVEKEPNDTYPNANRIDVAKTMRGRISGNTDTDFYRLALSTTKMLDVIFKTAPSAAGNYSLDVMIGETVINHITIPGSGATSTLSAGLFPGDYYVKVTGTGVNSADDYTIEVREMTGVDREVEGNNTKAFANGLTPGKTKQARLHSSQDIDFFGVTYAAFGSFIVTIKPVTAGTDYNVKVYNAEDRLLQDFTTQGSAQAYREFQLWTGNYYIKVTGAKEGDYTLLYEGDGNALKELVKLAIVEAPQRIDVGSAAPLKLVGSFTDGSVIDLSTAQATWTTSDATKATASGNVVTGVAAGSATIYANYGGQMAKVDLEVGQSVTVKKQTYGNLILVAGGGAAVTNTLRESTQYLANTTYNRFLGRGFRMEDIFYFNPIPWQDINGDGYGDPVVTEKTPTVAGLRSAIETWALHQQSSGPLYLVLIDHGGIDRFEVFPGEIITAAQLDASMSAFETVTGREVVVMIEACKSGSFVNDLAKAGSRRMVITSTNEGNAYLDLQGRVSFTQFFIDQVYSGNTFRQSYLKTTQKLVNIGTPYSMMAPQLAEGQANTLSLTRLGGNFVIAGLFPEIKSQTPDKSVLANTPQTFSATIDDLTGKTKVWAVVTPSNYRAPVLVGDLQAPQVALPTFDLTDEVNGQIDGVYMGTYNDFRYNGQYRIVFYARNADGLVVDSPPTLITVTGGLSSNSMGDVNGDNVVNLADAILAFQVMSGQTPAASVYKDADVNGDGKIGLQEVIYIMQKVAGIRQ